MDIEAEALLQEAQESIRTARNYGRKLRLHGLQQERPCEITGANAQRGWATNMDHDIAEQQNPSIILMFSDGLVVGADSWFEGKRRRAKRFYVAS
ncbi:hypothetical protein NDU88_009688 [Pleurodeles waltl]|uniref:Uncharacterized protein n=1 Tax=Pleurodeles waltl TaxID=8319 RepID=A0AAV7QUA6_PLEWA|nr:hypothetical protein NDU88_009688 [Pleurodeles waltl]